MNDPLFSRAWWRSKLFIQLSRILPPKSQSKEIIPRSVERILVIAPVRKGDYLVLSPLLAALRKTRPHARITVLVSKNSLELANVDPNVHSVILYSKSLGFFKVFRALRLLKAEVTIFPKGHPSVTESIALVIAGSKYRVGLSHPNHNGLFTHVVKHQWNDEHRSEAFVRMLAPFGVDPADVSRRLHLGCKESIETWAKTVFSTFNRGKPHIAVNVSAMSRNRVWTEEGWDSFIRSFVDVQPGVQFLVLGVPSDQALCKRLASKYEQVDTIETAGILEATALMALCDVLVTVDTGIVQTAAARQIPMAVLYNGDHEVYTRFGPQSVPHRAILAERGSPVATISADEVFHEVVHLLVQIRWNASGLKFSRSSVERSTP